MKVPRIALIVTMLYPVIVMAADPPNPDIEFHGDFTGDTFQANKARRVKEATEKNKDVIAEEDTDPPGNFVEYLITVQEGSDDNSVLIDINNVKGEVIERNNKYLPNILVVRINKSDRDALLEKLKQNPVVLMVGKNFHLKLE